MPKKTIGVEISVKLYGDERAIISQAWKVDDKALDYFYIAAIAQDLFVAARESYRRKQDTRKLGSG